jgi:hypothetical protein
LDPFLTPLGVRVCARVGCNDYTRDLQISWWIIDKLQRLCEWLWVRIPKSAGRKTSIDMLSEMEVGYGYLTVNPARDVRFPQQTLSGGAVDHRRRRLHQAVEGSRRTDMIGLIGATGLRIGEMLALRWRALDLDVGPSTCASRVRGQDATAEDAEGAADRVEARRSNRKVGGAARI